MNYILHCFSKDRHNRMDVFDRTSLFSPQMAFFPSEKVSRC